MELGLDKNDVLLRHCTLHNTVLHLTLTVIWGSKTSTTNTWVEELILSSVVDSGGTMEESTKQQQWM